MRHRSKPYHAVPTTRSKAPARQFLDLDDALCWAERIARRFGCVMTVWCVGDGNVKRIDVE